MLAGIFAGTGLPIPIAGEARMLAQIMRCVSRETS